MVTNPAQMALGIVVIVVVVLVILVFVGPKVTAVSRKQWALLMGILFVLWIPMGWYLIYVVGTTKDIDPQRVVRAGALNLGIGVPLYILIARKWIFKK